ncbi:MAG: hypothetical protein AAF399_09530 [Bacteroidota bacterium]
MKANQLIVPVFVAISLFSCQANEQFEPFSPLISREWQLIGAFLDDTLVIEDCQLDDVLSFTGDRDFLLDFGADFCDSAEEEGPREGKWEFYDEGTALFFRYQANLDSGRGSVKRYWKVEITADTLWLREDLLDPDNPGGRETQRYVAVN